MAINVVETGQGVGHWKGGIYGDAGSGKTWTTGLIAGGLKLHLKHPGAIWFFDTEGGAEFIHPMLKRITGQNIKVVKSRALGDAIEFLDLAEKDGAAFAIIDSVTHIWDEVQKSWIKQYNEWAKLNRKPLRTKIEWQDRGQINDIWERLTTAYINSQMNVGICGRSANLWEMTVNEETGKKELEKIGTKMKTQAQLAYEPSFLAEMVRETYTDGGGQKIRRHITVLKERFGVMDGATTTNPTFDFFLPHVNLLTPGAHNVIDVIKETPMGISGDGDTAWKAEIVAKQIAFEKVCAALDKAFTGQGADMKVARQDVAELVFGTRSALDIERMPSRKLNDGLELISAAVETVKEKIAAEKKAEDDKVAAEKANNKKGDNK